MICFDQFIPGWTNMAQIHISISVINAHSWLLALKWESSAQTNTCKAYNSPWYVFMRRRMWKQEPCHVKICRLCCVSTFLKHCKQKQTTIAQNSIATIRRWPFLTFEPCHDKIQGFRQSPTQTGQCSHRRWLEGWNSVLGNRGIVLCSENKVPCFRICKKQGFSSRSSFLFKVGDTLLCSQCPEKLRWPIHIWRINLKLSSRLPYPWRIHCWKMIGRTMYIQDHFGVSPDGII